eukprot:5832466-Prymnesium_polylepis.1
MRGRVHRRGSDPPSSGATPDTTCHTLRPYEIRIKKVLPYGNCLTVWHAFLLCVGTARFVCCCTMPRKVTARPPIGRREHCEKQNCLLTRSVTS